MIENVYFINARVLRFIADYNSLCLMAPKKEVFTDSFFTDVNDILLTFVSAGIISKLYYVDLIEYVYCPVLGCQDVLVGFKVLRNGERSFTFKSVSGCGSHVDKYDNLLQNFVQVGQKGWLNMEEKAMDLESMNKYVEEAFTKVLNEELELCADNLEADLMYYIGYFTMASELGVITEDRMDEMSDTLVNEFNSIRGAH